MATEQATTPTDGLRPTALRGRSLMVCDDKPTFWAKAEQGRWEPELLACLEHHVRPGDSMLDIGAWVGPTTLFAASLGAAVVAVEADPAAAALLAANIAVNPGLAPGIRLVRRAAAPRAGTLRLGAPRKPGDSMSSALLADQPQHWEIETVTPAELLDMARPSGRGALVVKVDIEGGEYDLLPALGPALGGLPVRAVIVAFHPGLLRQAGRSEAVIAATTANALAALQGWTTTILDGTDSGEPALAACRDNVTLVFTPPS